MNQKIGKGINIQVQGILNKEGAVFLICPIKLALTKSALQIHSIFLNQAHFCKMSVVMWVNMTQALIESKQISMLQFWHFYENGLSSNLVFIQCEWNGKAFFFKDTSAWREEFKILQEIMTASLLFLKIC